MGEMRQMSHSRIFMLVSICVPAQQPTAGERSTPYIIQAQIMTDTQDVHVFAVRSHPAVYRLYSFPSHRDSPSLKLSCRRCAHHLSHSLSPRPSETQRLWSLPVATTSPHLIHHTLSFLFTSAILTFFEQTYRKAKSYFAVSIEYK